MMCRVMSIVLVLAMCAAAMAQETVWLDALDLSHMKQGWGKPQVKRSIRERPLAIAGRAFERGVGTHARSVLHIDLAGGCERFSAIVGVDDAANGPASLSFLVYGDGRKLFDSGLMKPGAAAREVSVDLKGVKSLLLLVKDGGDGVEYDHANWADAKFIVTGAKPRPVAAPREEPLILTPRPGAEPRINGPAVYGCRPGNPFIYRIPATGVRPMAFEAEGLPTGLSLDKATGIITGTTPERGQYKLTLKASNSAGAASRSFRIVSGDTLALTPPMGWNDWYAHYERITDKMMREAADVLVSSGMADAGYQFVCIDDCWSNAEKHGDPLRVGPFRDAQGLILTNKHFPDMKGLTDYIHAKGLKAGIYTSPGPLTCARFAASYQHEEQDVKQFADWGFDLLKYDWCSYGRIAGADKSLAAYQKPYRQMGDILKRQKRDIVYNLCQYGMGEVWKWGAEVGGHSWRTAGDLGFELDRFFDVALKNAEHREWNKPGAWNDPDYIQIGWIGNARGGGEPKPCEMTSNEQYSFMSLWCLMAAPIFVSSDITRLDEFTLNVLCNPEVIDINQDELGKCGRVVPLGEDAFAMVKEMADGSVAVGLFNRSEVEATVAAPLDQLGTTGPQKVRDLWRHKDLGVMDGKLEFTIGRHGVMMLRLWKAQ